MRSKINQTDEIQKLDQQRAKAQLKEQKQGDYQAFLENKKHETDLQKQNDRDYVNRRNDQDVQAARDQQTRQDVSIINI